MSHTTPGPWHPSPLTRAWGVYDQQGSAVARVGDAYGVAAERRAADARLISAAPALLEALRLMLDNVHDEERDDATVAAVRAARAALAQAS